VCAYSEPDLVVERLTGGDRFHRLANLRGWIGLLLLDLPCRLVLQPATTADLLRIFP
jgi:hypothetical protein